VPARPDGIDAIHELIESLWAQQPQLSDRDRMRFETAVIEVATNIIEHATKGLPKPNKVTIDLQLIAGPDRITARFRDDGSEAKVDLSDVQMPDATAEVGRGIALARALVDDVTYRRSASTNIWTVTCLRTDPKRVGH
jgi:serine/threonine-protein kinase RsbW